jgi:hypothetical protein
MDTIDEMLAESHASRMHAIALASIRYVQYLAARQGLDLPTEQADICGYTDMPPVCDGDYESTVAWLDSVSDASHSLIPEWKGHTN